MTSKTIEAAELNQNRREETTEAASYRRIANEIFAPLYPYYGRLILNKTGVRQGRCLDVGCGGGHLGLALAELADFDLWLLDPSASMLSVAESNLRERGFSAKAWVVEAVVEAMPLPDAFFDLVVSRGSIPFWKDLPAAFAEIGRVLKPGGHAYLGGGLGPAAMREQIEGRMKELAAEGRQDPRRKIPQRTVEEYRAALDLAGVRGYTVERGDEGTWIRFQNT
jgi:ubiquinone/menaquinone biosynthesis C-methylase UbiE